MLKRICLLIPLLGIGFSLMALANEGLYRHIWQTDTLITEPQTPEPPPVDTLLPDPPEETRPAPIEVPDTLDLEQDEVLTNDTILPTPTDSILPLPADTLPGVQEDTLVVPADTVPKVEPAPQPIPQAEVHTPEIRRPSLTPFDPQKVISVELDSLLLLPPPKAGQALYPAADLWGQHHMEFGHIIIDPVSARDSGRDHKTYWIIISLFFILISRFFFPNRFREKIKASYDAKSYGQLERDGGLIPDWASFLLYINFLMVLTLLGYQTLKHYGYMVLSHSTFLSLLYIFGAVILYYILRYVAQQLIAWIFKTEEATEAYLRNMIVINTVGGLAIFPFLIIYTYNTEAFWLYVLLVFFAAIITYKFLRAFYIGINKSGFSVYYIILYLCTVEIAPLLFLFKFSQNIIGY